MNFIIGHEEEERIILQKEKEREGDNNYLMM